MVLLFGAIEKVSPWMQKWSTGIWWKTCWAGRLCWSAVLPCTLV